MCLMAVISCAAWANAALTVAVWPFETVTSQVDPLQSPLKPEKVDPDDGVAVRLTLMPSSKLALQVDGQLIPAGLLVTVPGPETVTLNCAALAPVNVAETDWSLERVTWQDVPLHAPLNPEN